VRKKNKDLPDAVSFQEERRGPAGPTFAPEESKGCSPRFSLVRGKNRPAVVSSAFGFVPLPWQSVGMELRALNWGDVVVKPPATGLVSSTPPRLKITAGRQ